jgi:hypothetical protein
MNTRRAVGTIYPRIDLFGDKFLGQKSILSETEGVYIYAVVSASTVDTWIGLGDVRSIGHGFEGKYCASHFLPSSVPSEAGGFPCWFPPVTADPH